MKNIFLACCSLVGLFTNPTIAQSRFVKIDGGTLHYTIIGQGQPVLIINGGPGFSSEGFKPMAEKISSMGYQTIMYDQRGTGQSTLDTLTEKTITMQLMNSDIETIRKDMGIEQWTVFGHSFGGIMANFYAAHYPQHITAMVFSSSGGMDLTLLQTVQTDLMARLTPAEQDSLSYWRDQMMESGNPEDRYRHNTFLASAYLYNKKNIPIVATRLMEGDMALNRMVWNNLQEINYDCKVPLSTFQKPVLIIQGRQDIVNESLAHKADSVFPKSELILIDKCSHYGWLDQPEEYFGSIQSFLSEAIKNN